MAKKKPPEEERPEDVEVSDEVAQGSRPSTEANFFIQMLVGVLGTAAIAGATYPLKGTGADYIYGLINGRGPIQYIELFMAFMVAAQVILKHKIVRQQIRLIYDNPVETKVDLNNEAEIQRLRHSIVAHKSYGTSIVLSRMERILGMWLASKDVSRISGWASAESDRDTSSSDQSFALSRVLIWAIPILGFIGTVQGLGSAVAGFADFLSGSAELSQIKGAIADVTVGLGVAFDTTLLALILVTLLMFPLTSLQRREEGLFVEMDTFLDDVLISRLPSPEQQPIVIENLEDSIEAAFRRYIPDPDRYDEVFTRSIEKAAETVEEKFATLSTSYEASLRDLTGRLSNSFTAVGESVEGAIRKVVEDIRTEEQDMLSVRRDMAAEERERLAKLMEEVYTRSQAVAEEYQRSARDLLTATQDGTERSLQAAGDLAARMQDVARMAQGIEGLLKIEQSIEKGLAGISASQDFRQTLEDLRSHLATTDSFCSRLTRPRVITLREEVAEG